MINWKVTFKLIVAMIVVTIGALFGVQQDIQVVQFTSCGYAEVGYKQVDIYSNCGVIVTTGDYPLVEEDTNIVKIMLPEGWKWRIIPLN